MQSSNPGNIAAEVSKNFSVGADEDPLAFINNNLKATSVTNGAVVVEPPKKAAEVIANNPNQTVIVKEEVPVPKVEAKVDVPPVAKEPTSDLVSDLIEPKKTKEDSIKDLKKIATEAQKKAQERETELDTLKSELEKYKTGEALPTVVEEYKSKIKDLEKFRDLYDLESSPEYIKNYVEPVENTKNSLKPVFEEYGVPFEELERVLNEGSEKKLNSFLSEHFDSVAATDIKNNLNRIKGIRADGLKAKESPKQAIQQLLTNAREAETHQKVRRAETIDRTARGGWVKALTKLQGTDKYPELTLRGDPAHDNYVKPIMENAAKEYGVIVTWMANNGLSELPENIAEILSTRFALSEAAAVMAESRSQMFNEYNKVVKDTRQNSSYENPPIGTSIRRGGNVNGAESRGPNSPQEAGQELLRKIGMAK